MTHKTRNRKTPSLPDLSDLELDIMNSVWELGECSSAEVIAAVCKTRQLADTTIRTVLSNIRKKGYIEQIPSLERGFRFRPTVPREKVARRSLKKLIGSLFEGSARGAIMQLISDETIDEDDLREIRKIIDQRKAKGKQK